MTPRLAHQQMAHKGFVIWLTGLSGAGKSTIAQGLLARLQTLNAKVELLDGDIVRTNLSQGLGFSREDRDTNIRRIGFVAELLARNGVIVIVAAISPYRTAREDVKRKIRHFIEVHVDCPIEVLTTRDTKGLYRRALAGEIGNFTGISDPYEPPESPAVILRSDRETIDEGLAKIWGEVESRGLLG
jgi:adenylyl-sulfate kinase